MKVDVVYGYTPVGGMLGIRSGRCTGIRRWKCTWHTGYALVEVYGYTPVGGLLGIGRGRCTDIHRWRCKPTEVHVVYGVYDG